MPMVNGLDDARRMAEEVSRAEATDPVPNHWPGGTVAALALLVLRLEERVAELERLGSRP